MIAWIDVSLINTFAGVVIAYVLHATLLLSLVWLIERAGALKHPGWAELAWRAALFGALLSISVEWLPWQTAQPNAALATVPTQPLPFDAGLASSAESHASKPDVSKPDVSKSYAPAQASISAAGTQSFHKTQSSAAVAPRMQPFTSTPVAPLPLSLDLDALLCVLVAWIAGAVLLSLITLRQALALWRLQRCLARDGEPANAALQSRLIRLSREMDVRTPTLRVLSGITSPLVLRRTVLLPRWAEALDDAQQTAMLAHELMHLKRRDPLWRPLQRIALVPLFFHPLAWHAVRRLEALAETLCDQAAVERSGNPRALAECLAECLARYSEQRSPVFAVAMAERSGGIVGRIQSLMENSQMTVSKIPVRWRWSALVVALAALIALPGIVVTARDNTLSVKYRNGGSEYTMLSDMPVDGERLRIDADGDFTLNDDESDVVRLGRGATLEIEQTRGGIVREIRFDTDASGVRRRYSVDGKAHPLDAGGKAWVATVIPEFFRRTGLQAEARAKRMLATGGVPRLLQEIALLDNARPEYLIQLFSQATLDDAQLAQALTLTKAINSDSEMRRALTAISKHIAMTPQNVTRLLAMTSAFESDFERAEWLSSVLAMLPLQDSDRPLWTTTLNAFNSDFEHRRTIERLIDIGKPQPLAISIALPAIREIQSDFERRSALEAVAKSGVPVIDDDYLQAVDGMQSDFEQREALLALIRSSAPDLARSQNVLRSARRIESDVERGEVLTTLAATMPNDPALIEAYRSVARRMSDSERARAERALDRFFKS